MTFPTTPQTIWEDAIDEAETFAQYVVEVDDAVN
jgi:hypothetical protein